MGVETKGDLVHELPYEENAQATHLALLQRAVYAWLGYRCRIERVAPVSDFQTNIMRIALYTQLHLARTAGISVLEGVGGGLVGGKPAGKSVVFAQPQLGSRLVNEVVNPRQLLHLSLKRATVCRHSGQWSVVSGQ